MQATPTWKRASSRILTIALSILTATLSILVLPSTANAEDTERPVIWVTDQMLVEMQERLATGEQPFQRAWALTKAQADAALTKTYVPYQGTTFIDYYHTGRGQAQTVRNLALAYHATGDTRYADKGREIINLWAEDSNANAADSNISGAGLVIGRVMSIFADGYAMLWDTMSTAERVAVDDWMHAMVPPILRSQEFWQYGNLDCCKAPWLDQQYFQNQLAAQNMGIAVIGFATRDQELIDYALDGPDNPRNLETLIRGLILMPADIGSNTEEDIWKNDRTRTEGAPEPVPGEIYDRYRTVQGHGLHYTALSLRILTLTAEMALHNGEGDYFAWVGPNGENLELSFDFYSEFFITGSSNAQTGYYSGEPVEWAALSIWEIGARHYDSEAIIEALEVNDRVVHDYETFGWTSLLTHGLSGLDDKSVPAAHRWDFAGADDSLGWQIRKATASTSADGLVLDIPAGDPGIVSPGGLKADPAEARYLHLRMKNETTSTLAQLFFATEAAPGFSSARLVSFPVIADGEFHDYVIDMSQHSAWTGAIEQIRLDPVGAGPGTVTIKTVSLQVQPPWTASTVYESDAKVMHDGRVFTALWWTSGEEPGESPYGAWAEIAETDECGDHETLWTNSRVFVEGDEVVHDGNVWAAKWWTRNQQPSAAAGNPWALVADCA